MKGVEMMSMEEYAEDAAARYQRNIPAPTYRVPTHLVMKGASPSEKQLFLETYPDYWGILIFPEAKGYPYWDESMLKLPDSFSYLVADGEEGRYAGTLANGESGRGTARLAARLLLDHLQEPDGRLAFIIYKIKGGKVVKELGDE